MDRDPERGELHAGVLAQRDQADPALTAEQRLHLRHEVAVVAAQEDVGVAVDERVQLQAADVDNLLVARPA